MPQLPTGSIAQYDPAFLTTPAQAVLGGGSSSVPLASGFGYGNALGAAVTFGLDVSRAVRAGVRNVPLQASIARSGVGAVLGAIPGVNLLYGLSAILSPLIGRNSLENYQRAELRENPGLYSAGGDLSELNQLFIDNPEWGDELSRQLSARQAGVDPRTGAGISRETLLRESSPERIAEVRRAEALQSLPFSGFPSIFTRRRLS